MVKSTRSLTWLVAIALAAGTMQLAGACSHTYDIDVTCDALAAKLVAPERVSPGASAPVELHFSTPVGTRYEVQWKAERGEIQGLDHQDGGATAGAGGAGPSDAAADASTGAEGGASQAPSGPGDGGAEAGGSGGQAGEASFVDGLWRATYTAPQATGDESLTATVIRRAGTDDDGPASCSFSAHLVIGGDEGDGGEQGGAAGAGGEAGAGGSGGGGQAGAAGAGASSGSGA